MIPVRPDARAFYLETPRGPRYCLHHRPGGGAAMRGALVYVHPFAEEMNKSRRMAGVAARQFAAAEFEVLQIDLLGCGDSPGDFGDATWADWVADVRHAAQWLQGSTGTPPLLWGLRAGCLVCLDAARPAEPAGQPLTQRFLFWQPPGSGRLLAQQFLRLRIAADALRGPPAPDAAAAPREAPARQTEAEADPATTQEVAGYRLHPQLLAGLRAAEMQPPASPAQCAWIEVTSRQPAQLLPATARAAELWRGAGHEVHALAVEGPGFWQTQEINVVPSVLEASLAWLLRAADARAGAPP